MKWLNLFAVIFFILFIGKAGEIEPVYSQVSWWWVFSPIWIPIGAGIAILIIMFLGYFAIEVNKALEEGKRQAYEEHERKKGGMSPEDVMKIINKKDMN